MASFTLRVRRHSPAESFPPQYVDFAVPLQEKMTILDALSWVQSHEAHDLAFRYSCRVGMCGTCSAVINGRERWACRTLIEGLSTNLITVEPLRHLPIIKDLVVDMRPFFERIDTTMGYFVPGEGSPANDFARIPPQSKERLMIDPHIECISCGACYSSCTMVYWDKNYLGPAALNRAATLVMDSRDSAGERRLDVIDGEHGCWRCHSQFTCTEVCPMELRPTEAIGYLKRSIVSRSLKNVFTLKGSASRDTAEQSDSEAAVMKQPVSPGAVLGRSLDLISRPIVSALVVSIAAGAIYLLSLGAAPRSQNNDFFFPEGKVNPMRLAGALLFEENGCESCHSVLGVGGRRGPDLWRIGGKRDKDWLRKLFRDPDSVISKSAMPAYDLTEAEMLALVDYVHSLDFSRHPATRIRRSIVRGGGELYRNGCLECHQISDFGKVMGVELLRSRILDARFHSETARQSFARLSHERLADVALYLSHQK